MKTPEIRTKCGEGPFWSNLTSSTTEYIPILLLFAAAAVVASKRRKNVANKSAVRHFITSLRRPNFLPIQGDESTALPFGKLTHYPAINSQFLQPSLFENGYQGLRDFRGHGNLPLIVETLEVRCVAPAPNGVSIYGLPWCAFFSFYFLRYLRRRSGFSFQLVFRQGLRSGI
jgi:hypothetical protein